VSAVIQAAMMLDFLFAVLKSSSTSVKPGGAFGANLFALSTDGFSITNRRLRKRFKNNSITQFHERDMSGYCFSTAH
jgi:hypothetical protein